MPSNLFCPHLYLKLWKYDRLDCESGLLAKQDNMANQDMSKKTKQDKQKKQKNILLSLSLTKKFLSPGRLY